jgi:isopenicillin-N N-acyltransferase-like protein
MEIPNKILINPKNPLKYLEISGDAYDRGFEYGEKQKNPITRFIDTFYVEFSEGNLSKEAALRYASKHTPYIEDYSPEVMEELKGIAEGSEKKLEELVMVALHEEKGAFNEKCTALGATGEATVDGETFVGQNWDMATNVWWDGDMPSLLKIRRGNKPDVLAYVYPGFQSAAGMNSNGICMSWNSVPRIELKVGVPTYIIIADLLRQPTIGDALNSVLRADRAGCFNFMIGDDTEVYNVEATPHHIDIRYVETCFGHGNHFVSDKISGLQDMSKMKASTILRHNRMNRMLKKKFGNIILEDCMDMFRDHTGYPFCICSHPEPELDKNGLTWASWVQVPRKREWWISHGPPCHNEYKKYKI